MSDVVWNCEQSGFPPEGLTVGTPFELSCSGPAVAGFQTQSLGLELDKKDNYALRILETKEATEGSVKLVVTSYRAGENKIESAVITDGVLRVGLKGLQFDVQSVLNPTDPEPKPFPPEAPVGIAWPLWIYLSIAAIVIGILGIGFAIIRRRQRRVEFQAWLASNRTPLSPIDQLNKDFRRIMKIRNPSEYISELEKSMREFLARRTASPLLNASSRSVLKVVSDGDRRAREKLQPLTARLFKEFDRITESISLKRLDDKEALVKTLPEVLELAREYAEMVDQHLKARAAKRGRAK